MTTFNKHSFHTTKRHKIQSLRQIFRKPKFQIQDFQAHTPPRRDLSEANPKTPQTQSPKWPKTALKMWNNHPTKNFKQKKTTNNNRWHLCGSIDMGGSGGGQECRKGIQNKIKNPRRKSQSADKLPKMSIPRHLSPTLITNFKRLPANGDLVLLTAPRLENLTRTARIGKNAGE